MRITVNGEAREVVTIEGLGTPDRLNPLQATFLHHDALQCGYCTPEQICSATAMLDDRRDTRAMSGISVAVRPI